MPLEQRWRKQEEPEEGTPVTFEYWPPPERPLQALEERSPDFELIFPWVDFDSTTYLGDLTQVTPLL